MSSSFPPWSLELQNNQRSIILHSIQNQVVRDVGGKTSSVQTMQVVSTVPSMQVSELKGILLNAARVYEGCEQSGRQAVVVGG